MGDEFVADLADRLDAIEREPESFTHVEAEFRRAHLRRFPYHVYFAVEESRIQVIAVLHGGRQPDHWRRRADD